MRRALSEYTLRARAVANPLLNSETEIIREDLPCKPCESKKTIKIATHKEKTKSAERRFLFFSTRLNCSTFTYLIFTDD